MARKFPLPVCLQRQKVSEAAFTRWLHRKAMAHVRRDRARDYDECSVSRYKEAIYRAVEEAHGRDYYTGNPLDWHLISKWNNDDAKVKRGAYKREFWNLPTVDHEDPRATKSPFRLCSWRTNDAKNDQTVIELLELADSIRTFTTTRTINVSSRPTI